MSSERFNHTYLQKLLEKIAILNKSYRSAFSPIPEQIRGMKQSFDRTKLFPYSALLEEISKQSRPGLSPYLISYLEDQSEKSRLFRHFELPDELPNKLRDNLPSESRLIPYKLIQDNLYASLSKQISTWQKLAQTSLDISQQSSRLNEIAIASRVWDKSLTELTSQIEKLNLFAKNPVLVKNLLRPSMVYTDFVEKTYQRLDQSTNEKISWALETSLHLAEDQLLTTTNTFVNIITVPEDDELDSPDIELLLPIVQQNELIAIVESCQAEDEESLILLSPAAQESAKVRQILSLINQCNEVMQTKEQKEIFKPTTKILEAYTNLPWMIPQNKQSFGDFIDYLNFIFHEGAGKDNLRFLTEHGGVLEPSDCDFIWCIKHLRNKWLRHDADHGKESDIRKSWKEVSNKFTWLGLNHAPFKEQHFRLLHRSLLKEAEYFLERLLEKLIE